MKLSHLLIMALFGASLTLIACKDNKDNSTPVEETTVSPESTLQEGMTGTTGTAASANAAFHYICPNACEGGGGPSQGKCPVCGTDMVHNQAFHNQSQGAEGSSPANPIQVDPTATPTQATPTPPSATNAKGVYHYTCTKGCAGGAASAGNCAKCGSPLAHNQAYHDN